MDVYRAKMLESTGQTLLYCSIIYFLLVTIVLQICVKRGTILIATLIAIVTLTM